MAEVSWVEQLKQYNARHAKDKAGGEGAQSKEAEDEKLLEEYYLKFKGPSDDKKYHLIPKFYSKPPSDDELLQQKLREEARATFLQRRSSELMDNEELQKLWSLLEEKSTPPDIGEEQMISYTDFMEISEHVSEKCRSFFSAQVFAKLLSNDPYGRAPLPTSYSGYLFVYFCGGLFLNEVPGIPFIPIIPQPCSRTRVCISQLFSYIMRKVWLQQTRIGLSLFDIQGLGFLKESDLENYILELIPTLPQLKCLEESFYSFYVCTAVRKFFFFLDPMRTGKIKIQDILACGFLDDLLELRDEELSKEAQEANWFSAPSALRVYGQYLSLDSDHNGMLSKQELLRYGTGTLTKVFVDRVFQECLTYEGEVDYKTYLDFVLAMENRKETQSLQYLFRLVDIRGQGCLDAFTINYFFRAIQEQMKKHGHEVVRFEDIKDEIFDMVKPADPLRITLQDLINSGQGETVISILTDLNGFWTYENREVLLADNQDGGTG